MGLSTLLMAQQPRPTRRDDEHTHEHAQGELAVDTESDTRTQTPRLYRVLLHNDDYTTMEFVVMVLVSIFHQPEPEAVKTMLAIHQKGVGSAGVYSYEVAEARISRVARLARENDFPLKCSMEPE